MFLFCFALRKLFESLRQFDNKVATERENPTNHVLSSYILINLSRLRPDNIREFNTVNGITDTFTEQYGAQYLNAIKNKAGGNLLLIGSKWCIFLWSKYCPKRRLLVTSFKWA